MNGVLLLDVDGCLNPWASKRRPEGHVTYQLRPRGWEDESRPSLRVWLNPTHGRLLQGLATTTGWDLVWATTWERDANTLIAPRIGLPTLPVIEFSARRHDTLRGWKYPAVEEYARGRPVVWLDDGFGDPVWRVARCGFEFARAGSPTLLRGIDPAVGVTALDVRAVRAWVATLTRSGLT